MQDQWGIRRWLVGGAIVATASACFSPTFPQALLCGDGEQACPPGQSCGEDLYCHGEPVLIDASVGPEYDADPGAPDACTGACGVGLRAGLVAYWKLDGNLVDGAGAHTLVFHNSGATYVDGLFGQAVSQGGPSLGDTGGMETPNTGIIDLAGDFTLSIWVDWDGSPYDHDALFENGLLAVGKFDPVPSDKHLAISAVATDNTTFRVTDDSALGQVPMGQWIHVVAYRSGNKLGLRVNNAGSADADVTGKTFTTENVFRVGILTSGYVWHGRIDEVAVWNRTLSVAERTTLYGGGAGHEL